MDQKFKTKGFLQTPKKGVLLKSATSKKQRGGKNSKLNNREKGREKGTGLAIWIGKVREHQRRTFPGEGGCR